MTDNERFILLNRYLYNADLSLHNEYISVLNSFIKHNSSDPYDILYIYKVKIRYEAFKEFSSDLLKILYPYYRLL